MVHAGSVSGADRCVLVQMLDEGVFCGLHGATIEGDRLLLVLAASQHSWCGWGGPTSHECAALAAPTACQIWTRCDSMTLEFSPVSTLLGPKTICSDQSSSTHGRPPHPPPLQRRSSTHLRRCSGSLCARDQPLRAVLNHTAADWRRCWPCCRPAWDHPAAAGCESHGGVLLFRLYARKLTLQCVTAKNLQ